VGDQRTLTIDQIFISPADKERGGSVVSSLCRRSDDGWRRSFETGGARDLAPAGPGVRIDAMGLRRDLRDFYRARRIPGVRSPCVPCVEVPPV